MGKIVVVVESPAKCKKIEGFLGPGYKCSSSFLKRVNMLATYGES